MSFYCWGINSLGSERSPLGPKVSSKCGQEMARRCILSFVKTDTRWHGLHILLHEAVFAILQKDLCGWIFFLFCLLGFFFFAFVLFGWSVLGVFVCLFSGSFLCFRIHFGVTCFLKKDRFLLLVRFSQNSRCMCK